MISDHRIGATLACVTAASPFGALMGAASTWKKAARAPSIVRTPAHAEVNVIPHGLAAKRDCAYAIEVEVDGTVCVAADVLAKCVGLGHGLLRCAAIAGIAIGGMRMMPSARPKDFARSLICP
jgi:hypothetical protein